MDTDMQSDPTLTPDLPHNNHKTAEVALKVWMPKDLRNDLRRMAQSRSISLAALVRLVLSQYIRSNQ